MGKDAVVMATATTISSRWNTALPKQSLRTQDIDIKNATIQVVRDMLYVRMEIPLHFKNLNPLDDSTITIDFKRGCYFMVAAGPLDPFSNFSFVGPSYHHHKNSAINMVTIEESEEKDGAAVVNTVQPILLGCIIAMTFM